jgi:hypothetical protein
MGAISSQDAASEEIPYAPWKTRRRQSLLYEDYIERLSKGKFNNTVKLITYTKNGNKLTYNKVCRVHTGHVASYNVDSSFSVCRMFVVWIQ